MFKNEEIKYAVVVKDSNEYFLMYEINRNSKGNIYINGNESEAELRDNYKNFHWSKHVSGQTHHKSHGHYSFRPKKTQVLNHNFKDSEVIAVTSIRKGEARAWGVPYKQEDYSDAMFIEDCIITPTYGYQLQVEIIEPNTKPWISTYPYAKIIQQSIFKETNPWIVVTLCEINPDLELIK